ncbi:response regulator [Streptomyces sp. NTH33]|uniref:response regulator n=1 Tax=Streptomyces sp. NTH33 TaxID=1735453 RepID=UPI0021AC4C87|nr:response regulator [Streptomyces sp. NTH33]
MIKVLVVEDHAVVRSGLVTLLSAELGMRVVGEAADGEAALAEAELLRPDVILLDIDLPVLDDIAVAVRPHTIHVRDSKLGDRSPRFAVPADTWSAFLAYAARDA